MKAQVHTFTSVPVPFFDPKDEKPEKIHNINENQQVMILNTMPKSQ